VPALRLLPDSRRSSHWRSRRSLTGGQRRDVGEDNNNN
jgi:hypothetical protein